jgi:hypothetical protein
MKKYIPSVLVGLIVAAIWGYFVDLREGQVEWFVGRLVFVPLVIVIVQRLFAGKGSGEQRSRITPNKALGS